MSTYSNGVLVVKVRGKKESVIGFQVFRFDDVEDAESFCFVNTDLDDKYWVYSEIIEEGAEYEVGRYTEFRQNFKRSQ